MYDEGVDYRFIFADGSVAIVSAWGRTQKESRIALLASRQELGGESLEIKSTWVRDSEKVFQKKEDCKPAGPWVRVPKKDAVI